MHIYVFKTSVEKADFKFLKPVLDVLLSADKWNFDFADCDKILRIESKEDISIKVSTCLKTNGYLCIELE